jgi:hypothetical protein
MSYFTNDKKRIEFLNNKRNSLKKHQVYQHFKGGLYIVEDIARHSETGEEMVVYRNLKTGELWVRPKDVFLDIKKTEQGYTFRFLQHYF